MRTMQSRRNFLTTLSAAGAAGFMGSRRSFADEGPPETTTIRLAPAAGGGGPAARGGFHRHPLRVPAGILHLPADGGARRRPSRQFLRGNPRLSHGRRRARYGVVGVGLDPKSDFEWVISPDGKPMEVFAEGKADAFLAFPPEPQELRPRDIGRVLISTVQD